MYLHISRFYYSWFHWVQPNLRFYPVRLETAPTVLGHIGLKTIEFPRIFGQDFARQ